MAIGHLLCGNGLRRASGGVANDEPLFVFRLHVSADRFGVFGGDASRGVALLDLAFWPEDGFDHQLNRDPSADRGQFGTEDTALISHFVTSHTAERGRCVNFRAVGGVAVLLDFGAESPDVGFAVFRQAYRVFLRRGTKHLVEGGIESAGGAEDAPDARGQLRGYCFAVRFQGVSQNGAAILTTEEWRYDLPDLRV